jgi:hypothetical protein
MFMCVYEQMCASISKQGGGGDLEHTSLSSIKAQKKWLSYKIKLVASLFDTNSKVKHEGLMQINVTCFVPEHLSLIKLLQVSQYVTAVPNSDSCRNEFPNLHRNGFLYNMCWVVSPHISTIYSIHQFLENCFISLLYRAKHLSLKL